LSMDSEPHRSLNHFRVVAVLSLLGAVGVQPSLS